MLLAVRLTHLVLTVLYFLRKPALCFSLTEGECQRTGYAAKLVCKSSEDTHLITLDLQCEGEEAHNMVYMCKDDGCSCQTGLNCEVKESTATRREVVVHGLECSPVNLICNPVGGSPKLVNCILASSGTGPSPVFPTSPHIMIADQSVEGECRRTRSAVKLVCKFSEDTHSVTLEIQCEGKKIPNMVYMCKDDGCSCQTGLNCDIKESTATRREVVVYGLECLPVSLICNPVGGSPKLVNCIFASSGTGPSPSSTTSPLILSENQSPQNMLYIILPISIFTVIVIAFIYKCCPCAFMWTSLKCCTRCINRWKGGLENNGTEAVQQLSSCTITIPKIISEDNNEDNLSEIVLHPLLSENDLHSVSVPKGNNLLTEEVMKFTEADAKALKISGTNASSSLCSLDNEAASIKQKCGTGAEPESDESSKIHKIHSSEEQSYKSAREFAVVEDDYAIHGDKGNALIPRKNVFLPDVGK
ncbi:uncharacterized protein LOC112568325 isoform X3 [Pomacea canaliculata]|uniref:uncharacterized protein LOC112568325 isoform X3 n=1 Tax=Pomacea canaliculata TaxID=400727 RepID=UPI000D73C994|nr:uncharacterized protein LOC112568325 isoform X3 [Pomacea canaliculata]